MQKSNYFLEFEKINKTYSATFDGKGVGLNVVKLENVRFDHH